MPRVIAHVDMDAFFAAIEQRDNPSLRGRPVIVGADPKNGKGRGVVSTCSYEARRFGIHSAMPISLAYRRCRHAVFLPVDMDKYHEVSRQLFEIFHNFTPDVEEISVDEAFLDLTGVVHFYGTPYKTAVAIKENVKKTLGLTCSVGIAPIKMAAKIASDLCKPDGLLEVTPKNILKFLWSLPVAKLWGVGPKSQIFLQRIGIRTIGQLAQADRQFLYEEMGEVGLHLHDLANGIDERKVETTQEIKSVSQEYTFSSDTTDIQQLHQVLLALTEKVSRRLRQDGVQGRTITLKIRLKGFKTYTRAFTLAERTNHADTIFRVIRQLFHDFFKEGMEVRLVGVRVSNFANPYVKGSLFESEENIKREKLHQAIDVIKDRFGEESIRRGF